MLQLAKLPLLVQHFTEHKDKDADLSLWKFLCMHYYENDTQDGDDEKDMKLPFKSHKDCINTVIIGFIPNHVTKVIPVSQFPETKNYLFYNQSLSLSSYFSFVWQPPKFC